MKPEAKKQVAKALLDAANALSAASSVHLIFEDGDDTEALFEQAHDLFKTQGIYLHRNYDRFFVLVADADDERVTATAAMCLYDTNEPPSVEFSVAVAPDQQRKGLAKKLVEEVIRYTRQESVEFGWGDDTEVEAYVVNDKAMVPLLRSLGFEPSSSDPKRWHRKISGSSVLAATPTRLYRSSPSGKFGYSGEFWATDPDYPKHTHGDAPYRTALLSPEANVVYMKGSPSKQVIRQVKKSGYDAAAFELWDGPGLEYVILNPHVLTIEPSADPKRWHRKASGSSVQASTLTPTDELISKMKKFFEHKWKTEKNRPDLTGACVFATAFAEELLGGTPTGNWHHVYLDWYGKKRVDLTEAYGVREQALERLAKQKEYEENGYSALARAMTPVGFVGPDVDPYMVDKKFLRSRDFKDTWDSVLARATRWADEFRESLNNESSRVKFGRIGLVTTVGTRY